eukprot:Opistho-2@69679
MRSTMYQGRVFGFYFLAAVLVFTAGGLVSVADCQNVNLTALQIWRTDIEPNHPGFPLRAKLYALAATLSKKSGTAITSVSIALNTKAPLSNIMSDLSVCTDVTGCTVTLQFDTPASFVGDLSAPVGRNLNVTSLKLVVDDSTNPAAEWTQSQLESPRFQSTLFIGRDRNPPVLRSFGIVVNPGSASVTVSFVVVDADSGLPANTQISVTLGISQLDSTSGFDFSGKVSCPIPASVTSPRAVTCSITRPLQNGVDATKGLWASLDSFQIADYMSNALTYSNDSPFPSRYVIASASIAPLEDPVFRTVFIDPCYGYSAPDPTSIIVGVYWKGRVLGSVQPTFTIRKGDTVRAISFDTAVMTTDSSLVETHMSLSYTFNENQPSPPLDPGQWYLDTITIQESTGVQRTVAVPRAQGMFFVGDATFPPRSDLPKLDARTFDLTYSVEPGKPSYTVAIVADVTASGGGLCNWEFQIQFKAPSGANIQFSDAQSGPFPGKFIWTPPARENYGTLTSVTIKDAYGRIAQIDGKTLPKQRVLLRIDTLPPNVTSIANTPSFGVAPDFTSVNFTQTIAFVDNHSGPSAITGDYFLIVGPATGVDPATNANATIQLSNGELLPSSDWSVRRVRFNYSGDAFAQAPRGVWSVLELRYCDERRNCRNASQSFLNSSNINPTFLVDENCGCSGPGTVNTGRKCNPVTGACLCKSNVSGAACDTCKPFFFNLAQENPSGCTPCSCIEANSLSCGLDGKCLCKASYSGSSCANYSDTSASSGDPGASAAKSSGGGIGVGVIAGAAVGGVAVVGAAVGIAIYIRQARVASNAEDPSLIGREEGITMHGFGGTARKAGKKGNFEYSEAQYERPQGFSNSGQGEYYSAPANALPNSRGGNINVIHNPQSDLYTDPTASTSDYSQPQGAAVYAQPIRK